MIVLLLIMAHHISISPALSADQVMELGQYIF